MKNIAMAKNNSNFFLLVLFVMGTMPLSLYGQNFESLGHFGNENHQIEVLTTEIDLGNQNSSKNQKVVQELTQKISLEETTPIIVEAVDKQIANSLSITPLTLEQVEEFTQIYQLKNPLITQKIADESIQYLKTGELPPELQDDIIQGITDPSWEKSYDHKVHVAQKTKAKGIAGRFGLSRSTARLTLIRMTYNGLSNTLAAFISKRNLLKSLILGGVSALMTGSVQVNNRFFEKVMASKYAKLKFFGIEAAFVSTSILISTVLGIKDYTWLEYAIDVLGFGLATTLTQGRAEETAAKQIKHLESFIDREITRIYNDTNLSEEAKSLLLDRLIARKANLTETFSRVMLGGSMIWSTAIALGATLSGTAGKIASYSVFGALHLYALTIKYVGSDKMMSFHPKAYEQGIIKFLKNQINAPKRFLNFLNNDLMEMGRELFCNSLFRKN